MNIKKTIDNALHTLSKKPKFNFFISLLFFLMFGISFSLIYLDSVAIKEQIDNDFNQQQIILARHASSQISSYLDNLEIQFQSLERFCSTGNPEVRKLAIRNLFDQNKGIGLMDVGYIDESGNITDYFSGNEIPRPDSNIVNQLVLNVSGDKKLRLGSMDVVRKEKDDIYISSNISIKVYNERLKPGVIFCRLDVLRFLKKITGNIRSGRTGYTWVIDDTGLALYHPEKEFVGRNIFEARQERKPYVNFTQINQIMKERMMKGEEGMSSYESWWHRDLKGKVTKLIAFTPIKHHSLPMGKMWSIAVVAPTSEVAEAVDDAYFRHFGAEAFLILGMFLFAIMMMIYQRKVSASLKERVTEQEEYISSILENSIDAIVFTDKENLVQVWNKGAEKMFGYTANEMKGKGFELLIPPEMDHDQELKHIHEIVMRQGYISNYIAPRITKSGRRITVNISRTLITSSKGENIGSSIVVRDETEKMELEQRIYNTEKLASIGTLAAGIAHEINNPLTVMLGYTDLLLENFEKGSPEYNDLKVIESNGYNAKRIIENLLSFARITEGLRDDIDVKQSVETIAAIIRNTLLTKKINLEIDVPGGLPHVQGDVREFEQVLFNLINNSVYALKKSVDGKVVIKAYLANDMVSVDIIDNGEGISNKNKPRLFDPFFTTKEAGEGTGLGLSLCYGIINKFGGKINFVSKAIEDFPNEDTGTSFTVSLPVIKSQ
jgi:two-component system, NtrC family, sensor kinase